MKTYFARCLYTLPKNKKAFAKEKFVRCLKIEAASTTYLESIPEKMADKVYNACYKISKDDIDDDDDSGLS